MARIPAARPDVAIFDARLPDGSGIDVCREIRSQQPSTRALILTSFDDERALSSAILAGAAGYLLKDIKGNGLIEAIRPVAAGKQLIGPADIERLPGAAGPARRRPTRVCSASRRRSSASWTTSPKA